MQRRWSQLRVELRPQRPSAPQLQGLYELWLTKRRDDDIPSRSDIDPLLECDPRLVPNLFLIDVLRDPMDFRYRLIGTALVAVDGRDYTGKLLGDADLGRYEGLFRAIYGKVVADEAPLGCVGTLLWRRNEQLNLEMLHLPLTKSGDKVDVILGAGLFWRARDGVPVPAPHR